MKILQGFRNGQLRTIQPLRLQRTREGVELLKEHTAESRLCALAYS